MHNLSAAVVNYKEDIQGSKPDRSHGEEITCPDLFGVQRQKLAPTGRRKTVVGFAHVFADGPGTDTETKPSEFGLNSLLLSFL